jgi:predicted nucleic acid-binding protein
MRYLLESDSLSALYDLEAPAHAAVARRLASLEDVDQVFLSILALYELEYGFANAPEEKKPIIRQRISYAQQDFAILPLSAGAARLFGSFKAGLRRTRQWSDRGAKVHNIDLMMAATAVSEDCVLISQDSIYPDIQQLHPGLKLESWR